MKIEIEVIGGTDKLARFNLVINSSKAGELQVNRIEFTKLCDLLFEGKYLITEGGPETA